MNRAITVVLVATLFGGSLQALADDAPAAQPVKTYQQKMHECMTKERAVNAAASRDGIKKTCEAQIKTQQDHPSMPVAPNNAPSS